jgi:putative pyruvate formate lyase activating enzyme
MTDAATYEPGYRSLHARGELRRRADELRARLATCDICPLDCRVNRLEEEIARCYAGSNTIVSSYCPHFGEEPLLTGTRGVGNIFFGNCNLRCVYCQNHQISQNWREERRREVTVERLAEIMLELQETHRCHSIGLVSPTHFVPQILDALDRAASRGLRLPVVYNTNCYDDPSVLRLLDGVVDIYLPDLKYADADMGLAYSKVPDYPVRARAALREMFRQTGAALTIGSEGALLRGLIVRHLILPNDLAGTEESLRFIRDELSPDVAISLMAQYYPTHLVSGPRGESDERLILLNRPIRGSEYARAVRILEQLGFTQGWIQEHESAAYYTPDFADRSDPFADRRDFPAAAQRVNSSPS